MFSLSKAHQILFGQIANKFCFFALKMVLVMSILVMPLMFLSQPQRGAAVAASAAATAEKPARSKKFTIYRWNPAENPGNDKPRMQEYDT